LNDLAKNVILWVVIGIVLLSVFQSFGLNTPPPDKVVYSAFLDEVRAGRVANVILEGQSIHVTRSDNSEYEVTNPETEITLLIGTHEENEVTIDGSVPDGP
jgi:cell division protease FtsH